MYFLKFILQETKYNKIIFVLPMPASPSLTNTAISEINTSGADEPAAINVAPATSWSKFNFYKI